MDSREKNFKVGEIILFESRWEESGREENMNDARRQAVAKMTGAQTAHAQEQERNKNLDPGSRMWVELMVGACGNCLLMALISSIT